MDVRERIKSALKPVAIRLAHRGILERFLWWLSLGLVVSIPMYGVIAWGPWYAPEWLCLIPLTLCGLTGLALAARVRVSDREAARLTDERLAMREELGTAVELAITGERSPMADALLARAAATCETLDARAVVPRLAPPLRRFRFLGLIALLGAVLTLTAAYWPLPPEEVEAREAMQRQAKRIEEIAKQVRREAPELLKEDAEKLAEHLEKLAKEFEKGRLTKREGLEALADISEELRAQQDSTAEAQGAQDVREAIDELRNVAMQNQDVAEIADMMKDNQFGLAQEKMAELAQKLSEGSLTEGEREQMAQDLEKMADALSKAGGMEGAAEALRKAAEALKTGDMQAASEAAQQAAQALSEALEGSEALGDIQALEQMLQDLEFSMNDVAGMGAQAGDQVGKGGGRGDGHGARLVKPSELFCEGFDPNAPGGPGPGGGTTNEEQAAGPEGQTGQEDLIGKDAPLNADYEELYAPRETAHGSEDTRVRGMPRQEGESAFIDIKMAPFKSEAYSPHYDVGGAASAATEDALNDQAIPRHYREQVREYFESLN